MASGHKKRKKRAFESLEKRELLDGKGDLTPELIPIRPSNMYEVQITDLLSRANLEKSSLSTEFLRASVGQMRPVIYGGTDGGTQDLDPNIVDPLDNPNKRIDDNNSSTYGGVVGIEVDDGFGVLFACSGTVVAPNYVLTAAHCFDNRDANGNLVNRPAIPPDGVVDPGSTADIRINNGGDSTDLIEAEAIILHPSYLTDEFGAADDDDNGHDDLALVRLSESVDPGTPIYPLREQPMTNTDLLQLVGYGRAGWGDFGLVGSDPVNPDFYDGINPTLPLTVKRVGENIPDFLYLCDDDQIDGNTSTGCGAVEDEVYFFDFDNDTDPSGLGNTREATVAPGDSGGPAFYDNNGTLELAGVNTFQFTLFSGGIEGKWGAAGGGMIVDRYADWINGIIGVDVQLAGAVQSVVAGPGADDTTVTYRVTVTNGGPNTATGIDLADTITLPTGVTITNADLNADLMVGTLAPAASTTVDIVFEVDGDTASTGDTITIGLVGSSVETELASGDNTLNDTIDLSDVIGVDVQLAGAVQSVVGGPGATDTTVTYRVTVTNGGPNTATGIDLADTITLPTGVTITNADLNADLMVGTLAPAASTTVDIVFEVDGDTASTGDTITIGLVGSSVETELASGDNTLNDTIDLSDVIGVDVQLAGAVQSVVAGPGADDTTVTYRVTVTNGGPNTATGIDLADTITLPAGVTITNADLNADLMVGTLAPAASTTVDIVFEVDGDTASTGDTITIGLVGSSVETELASGDNTLNDTIDLSDVIGVDVQLAGAVQSVVAGPGADDTTVTYRVTVTNGGPNTATGIDLADTITLPTGVTITNADLNADLMVGTLAPAASTTVDIVFEVDGDTASTGDTITIGLVGSSVETELASGDNTLNDTIDLSDVIGVDVQLAGAVQSVVAGPGATDTTVTYRVTVTNGGPNTATGIDLADTITLPTGGDDNER